MKLADAPKQIAIKNAFVGSIEKLTAKYCPRIKASGDKIIATAALDINADVKKVTKYNIETTLRARNSGSVPRYVDSHAMLSLKRFPAPVFSIAIPIGTNNAIKNITGQLIES